MCLITNASSGDVLNVAEKLRSSVETKDFIWNGSVLSITVTIGVALSTESRKIERLVAIADERLYSGKGQGRNRVSGPESL